MLGSDSNEEEITMANLTTKELGALEDQLGLEQLLCCKYQDAANQTGDAALKQQFQGCAQQHKTNYTNLLNFLQ